MDKNLAKLTVALGYPIWIISLILVFVEKKDKFVRFHAFQALFFGLSMGVIFIIYSFISSVLIFITFGLASIMIIPLTVLIVLTMIGFSVVLAIKAYKGEKFMLPGIGKYAKQFSGMK